MGLFGGTKSNSTKSFEKGLADGENILAVYRLVVDEICFTNKRIIFHDKTVMSTQKCKVSIPYQHITSFAIEDEGIMDRDIDVKLFVDSREFNLKFSKSTAIEEVEKLLTAYICQ